jgi:hypothetical protein
MLFKERIAFFQIIAKKNQFPKLCVFKHRTMDKVQKLCNPNCYVPSSEPYRIQHFEKCYIKVVNPVKNCILLGHRLDFFLENLSFM